MKLICTKCGTEDVVESVLIYANSALNYESGLYYKYFEPTDKTNTDIWCPYCNNSEIMSDKEYKTTQMKKITAEADAAMARFTKKLKKEAKKWEK